MNKITFKILTIASAILFVGACTNIKNKESTETVYKANGDAVYPTIEGMIPHAVTVSDKGTNEANYKVQLAVGKMMEVDCNQHNMEGVFEHETLEGYGYDYYVFKTNGNVASTMMACPPPSTIPVTIALPMPLAPPVTITFFPVKSIRLLLSFLHLFVLFCIHFCFFEFISVH